MKLLLKMFAAFAVIGLVLLLLLSYLETEHGWKSNATEVLQSVEAAVTNAAQAADEFLDSSGIKAGAEYAFNEAVALINPTPDSSAKPDSTAEPKTTAHPDVTKEPKASAGQE